MFKLDYVMFVVVVNFFGILFLKFFGFCIWVNIILKGLGFYLFKI